MQSHTKFFKYDGGCLVGCPRSRRGGALTGGLAGASDGASNSPVVVTSSCSPDGAPPSVGVCTFGIGWVFRSDGIRLGVGGGGRTSVDTSGRSSHTKSSSSGMTTSYSGPCRRRPRIVVCLLGSNNGGRGGFSDCIWASPKRLQASLILYGHLS